MSSAPLSLKRPLTVYRVLTGPDDASFCHRVTEALSKGWLLYGAPSLAFDTFKGHMVCAQAVTKDVDDIAYSPDLKLGTL